MASHVPLTGRPVPSVGHQLIGAVTPTAGASRTCNCQRLLLRSVTVARKHVRGAHRSSGAPLSANTGCVGSSLKYAPMTTLVTVSTGRGAPVVSLGEGWLTPVAGLMAAPTTKHTVAHVVRRRVTGSGRPQCWHTDRPFTGHSPKRRQGACSWLPPPVHR